MSKHIQACSLSAEELSLEIHRNFQELRLEFLEKNHANMHYTVVFDFLDVKMFNTLRFVLSGTILVVGEHFGNGYIEYDFATQTFFRVRCSENNVIRRIYPLIIDPLCEATIVSFVSFIQSFKNKV